MTDLNALANTLRAQAASNSTLVLDSTVFPAAILDSIRTAFMLAAETNLTITGVQPADVPAPVNGVLTITAGTALVLNQSGVGMGLTFTAPGGTLVTIIMATMSAAWKFTDSFEGMNFFPFQELNTTDVKFVFTTTEQTAYPWPDEPSSTIDLQAGLNFLSNVTLNNFSAISSLLGNLIGSTPFKFYGPFSPAIGQPLPVGTIRASLGSGTFGIGVAPNALTVGSPGVAVRIGIADALNPIQSIDLLVEGVFNEILSISIAIPMSGSTLALTTIPLPHDSSINSLIESLPGGKDFASYIPSELSKIFANVGLDYFTMIVDPTPKVTYFGFSISTLEPWPVIPDTNILILKDLKLQIAIMDPTGLDWIQIFIKAQAKFLPNIFPGEFDFIVGIEKLTSWEVSTVSGSYFGNVNLGDIVGGVLGSPDSVPAALRTIVFSNFGASATRSGPGSPFTYSFYGSVETAFPLLGCELTAQLNLSVTKTPTSYSIILGGSLVIGSEAFTLSLDLSTTDSSLSAAWQSMGQPLEFEDIAAALGFTLPTIPSGLELSLKSASFTYDFTSAQLVLTADSLSYGSSVFVSLPVNDKQEYFFLLQVNQALNLSNLPLINSVLSKEETVQIDHIQCSISSYTIPANDPSITTINNMINKLSQGTDITYPNIPTTGLLSGVGLSMVFSAGQWQTPLNISTDTSNPNGKLVGEGGLNDPTTTLFVLADGTSPAPAQSSDTTTWFDLQKTFGPVSFQKVGIRYQDGILYLLMNASLSAGGLTISLMGLGAGSPLTTFQLHFTISGIEITFQEGPVDISGALVGTLDPVNFYGELVLGVEELQISALGGYAEADGHPSFFLYAVLNDPIGGPSFFFVTGLAAGFGFNRSLVIPDVSGVATFPLVQWATGSGNPPGMNPGGDVSQQVSGVLNTLQTSGVVAPSVGSYWLALGIKFTSFEIVNSFALLTVTFGTKFEIDLLGLSTLSIPPDDPSPVAQVQIELKVSFSPDTGLLAIAGQLTPQSYVLSQACHLTGGFAFYLWFAGEHAGEVVLTLGGYNPNFTVPTYYPQVPRIGMNWKVTDDLSITGELYFALTSNAVMAGGKMNAVWQSGSIRAWFTVWADFLMVFKPFHYYIDAGIDMGASFSVKLAFVRVSVTIHVGVNLEIWGPEFAGKARVDLSIISFTVSFGSSTKNTDTTIPWSEFMSTLLPSQSQQSKVMKARALAASSAPTGTPAPVQINITQGMIKVLDAINNQPTYLVSGETFQCNVTSVIPTKGVPSCKGNVGMAPDSQQPHDSQGNLIQPNENFGAGPAGIQPSDFNPNFTLEVDTETDSMFLAVRMLNNASKALWENKTFDPNTGVPQVDPSTGLTETTLTNTQQGFLLVPTMPMQDHTLPIPLPALEWNLDAVINFWWSDPTYPTTDSFNTQTVASTINTTTVSTVRSQLLTAIGGQGLTINSVVEVSSLSDPANNDLLDAPQLRLLGEQKSAS